MVAIETAGKKFLPDPISTVGSFPCGLRNSSSIMSRSFLSNFVFFIFSFRFFLTYCFRSRSLTCRHLTSLLISSTMSGPNG